MLKKINKMKIYLAFILIMFFQNMISQTIFETKYIKGENSSYCIEDNYAFLFDNKGNYYYFIKADKFVDKIILDGPSKLKSTGYDDYGVYYELWTPSYYLDSFGIDEYNSVNHYAFKIFYDRRGGNAVLVYEFNMDSKSGTYYITEKGSERYCD